MLANFDTEVAKRSEKSAKEMQQDLDKIYADNKDKTLDDKLLEKITGRLAKGLDPVTEQGVAEDLKNILVNGKSVINENLAETISNNSKKMLAERLTEEQVLKLAPTKEELTNHFKNTNVIGKEVGEDEANQIRVSITRLVFDKAKSQGLSNDKLKFVKKGMSEVAGNAIKANSSSKLDENAMKNLAQSVNQ